MIELIQFPWSNFCAVARRILEASGADFKITNVPNGERSLVWKITGGKYYGVPVLRDGRKVIFESGDDTQDVARYLDRRFKLGLFPKNLAGIQDVVWRHIEDAVETPEFKLSDSHWREYVPKADTLGFVRHKERKFGRGCLDRWAGERKQLLAQFESALAPYEAMLATRPWLLDERPRFVDFDLYGMFYNFLWSGHYAIPQSRPRLREWYGRVSKVKLAA
ncbi:MAG: glutathione S-transferase [Verrucomicrobia bacterium]|nr:glutathione S-transferase [Verrucomicrobiota bacterium]